MNTIYLGTDNEDHWREMRARDVTSTESATLFGLGKYSTELELFHRKASGEIIIIDDHVRMLCGRELESGIANIFGSILECQVKPFKLYARDPDDRMGGSFDFEILDGKYAGWLLEIKNVDRYIYLNEWEDDEAPDHIEVQVQHQLELTQRPGAIIGALVGGNDPKFIVRERNAKMGAAIRNRIRKFWTDIETNNPPEPDFAKDADFIISLHQLAGKEVLALEPDDPRAALLSQFAELKAHEKDIGEKAKAAKAEILTLIGDDVGKVVCDYITPAPKHTKERLSLSCGRTKDTAPTLITDEMIGTEIGGRKGYRMFTLRRKEINE